MTKRAGKRKHRNGSQRHPPGVITNRPDTLTEDNLSKKESLSLELQALAGGWLMGGELDGPRKALFKKVLSKAHEVEDVKVLCRILQTLSKAEQNAIALKIQASGINRGENVIVVKSGNEASDRVAEFVTALSPESQQEFLNNYGNRKPVILQSER